MSLLPLQTFACCRVGMSAAPLHDLIAGVAATHISDRGAPPHSPQHLHQCMELQGSAGGVRLLLQCAGPPRSLLFSFLTVPERTALASTSKWLTKERRSGQAQAILFLQSLFCAPDGWHVWCVVRQAGDQCHPSTRPRCGCSTRGGAVWGLEGGPE